MLIFCAFIQVYVFTTNHHLNRLGGLSLPRKSVVRLRVHHNQQWVGYVEKCRL